MRKENNSRQIEHLCYDNTKIMGRKLKLTVEIQQKICDYISQGLAYETAALLSGVSERTLHRWRALGEGKETGKYSEFVDALQVASAKAEEKQVGVVVAAGSEDWHAAAWWLERRNPGRWSKVDRVDANLRGGAEVVIVMPDNGRNDHDNDSSTGRTSD